jgi:hypothetical protein
LSSTGSDIEHEIEIEVMKLTKLVLGYDFTEKNYALCPSFSRQTILCIREVNHLYFPAEAVTWQNSTCVFQAPAGIGYRRL